MNRDKLMQALRVVMMVVAIAGIIWALEYMERSLAVWFWVTLLGVGFVGLLATFRITRRRMERERKTEEEAERRRQRRSKRK